MTGIEPAMGVAVHFTDIVAGAMYQSVVRRLPGHQLKAGNTYMKQTLDLAEQNREILPPHVFKELSAHYRSAQDAREKYSRKGNFLRSWGASRIYKAEAKAALKLAELESSKARAHQLFAEQVGDQFVRIAADESTEILTNEEMDDIRSKVVESTLDLTLAIRNVSLSLSHFSYANVIAAEGKVSVEVSAIAADTAKLVCQALGDPNNASIIPTAKRREEADNGGTLESITE
ncbi:hypothetical protein EVG20_g7532 [Dentipellis fragilis]|uniref:Uncharacterized protein n=1 Tax=Dentipellis fragilis TaxID=205917 RepID=A0A4Y9YCR8_9AGAM|nr:hypothetical protein EVG20_g7532 [Dentipellis fragilis]